MNTVNQLLDEAQELIVAHRLDHAIKKLIEVIRVMTAETQPVEAEKPAAKATKATTKAKAKAEAPAEPAPPPRSVGTRTGDISSAPNGTIIGG